MYECQEFDSSSSHAYWRETVQMRSLCSSVHATTHFNSTQAYTYWRVTASMPRLLGSVCAIRYFAYPRARTRGHFSHLSAIAGIRTHTVTVHSFTTGLLAITEYKSVPLHSRTIEYGRNVELRTVSPIHRCLFVYLFPLLMKQNVLSTKNEHHIIQKQKKKKKLPHETN